MLGLIETNYRNVLVTAWNDSGAGRFMRLMDGIDKVFCFPFELLLGAESTTGIVNEPGLVSGKYRWNVFRDSEKIYAISKRKSTDQKTLDPSESELKEWLASKKFVALSKYRASAKAFLKELASLPSAQRLLVQIDDVHAYVEALKRVFTERESDFNLIHCPCAALDWESPQFWQLYNMAILITIDPKWGLGNMHSRNNITPHRYLERWHRINEASFELKRNHPGQVLVLCSSIHTAQQSENVARAYEFLDIRNSMSVSHEPTLLGEAIGELGFPYGGILNWNQDSYNSSIAKANTLLASADDNTAELLSKCQSLYTLLNA